MIEVLKPGNKKQIECHTCGALLRYAPEDVQKEKPIVGMAGYKHFIICPECNNIVVIEQTRGLRVKAGILDEYPAY